MSTFAHFISQLQGEVRANVDPNEDASGLPKAQIQPREPYDPEAPPAPSGSLAEAAARNMGGTLFGALRYAAVPFEAAATGWGHAVAEAQRLTGGGRGVSLPPEVRGTATGLEYPPEETGTMAALTGRDVSQPQSLAEAAGSGIGELAQLAGAGPRLNARGTATGLEFAPEGSSAEAGSDALTRYGVATEHPYLNAAEAVARRAVGLGAEMGAAGGPEAMGALPGPVSTAMGMALAASQAKGVIEGVPAYIRAAKAHGALSPEAVEPGAEALVGSLMLGDMARGALAGRRGAAEEPLPEGENEAAPPIDITAQVAPEPVPMPAQAPPDVVAGVTPGADPSATVDRAIQVEPEPPEEAPTPAPGASPTEAVAAAVETPPAPEAVPPPEAAPPPAPVEVAPPPETPPVIPPLPPEEAQPSPIQPGEPLGIREAVAAGQTPGTKRFNFADDARARLAARAKGTMPGGEVLPGSQTIADLALVGAEHLANGITDRIAWTKQMLGQFGEWIRPHLDAVWAAAQAHFGERVGDDAQVSVPALAPEQARVRDALAERFRSDPAGVLREYREKYGNVVSADNAKELSPDFQAKDDRTDNSAALHGPSSAIAAEAYRQILSEPTAPGKENAVLFTAGGPGSGKTTGMGSVDALAGLSDRVHAVYDGTMGGLESSRRKIRAALDSDPNRKVVVIRVHRDPVEAVKNGVIPRANRDGRMVPLEGLLQHADIPETMAALQKEFGDDPRVTFHTIDNTRGPGKAVPVANSTFNDLHYDRDELAGKFEKAIRDAHADGRIQDRVLRAANLPETKPDGSRARSDEGASGQREPAGGGVPEAGPAPDTGPPAQAPDTGPAPEGVASELPGYARAAQARLEARASGTTAGGEAIPGLSIAANLGDLALVGAGHIQRGLTDFASWSKRMVEDYGPKIQEHLQSIWTAAQQHVASLREGEAIDVSGQLPDRPGKDKIINLDHYGITDPRLKAEYEAGLEANRDRFENLKGRVTSADVKEAAKTMGLTEDDAQRIMKGKGLPNKAEFYAVRTLIDDGITKLKALGESVEAAKASGDPEALRKAQMDFAAKTASHSILLDAFVGKQAELARTLSFFKLMTDPATMATDVGGAFNRSMSDLLLGKLRKRGVLGGGELSDKVLANIRAAVAAGDVKGAQQQIRKAYKFTLSDKLYEAYLNGLLSPVAAIKKAASDLGSLTFRGVERGTAALLDAGLKRWNRSPDNVRMGEARAHFEAITDRKMFGSALQAFSDAYNERPVTGLGESIFDSSPGAIGGTLGKVVRSGYTGYGGMRTLKAVDAFTNILARAAERNVQAFRIASDEGGSTNDVQARQEQLFRAPDEKLSTLISSDKAKEVLDKVDKFAKKVTFSEDYTPAWQAADRAITMMPGGRWLVPFRKISLNLAKQGYNLTPLAFINGVGALRSGAKSPGEAFAMPLLGSALMTTIWAMSNKGLVTGVGPEDPKENATKRATGWQPKSFYDPVDKKYISYASWEPFAIPISLAASIAEAKDEKTGKALVMHGAAALEDAFTKRGLLTGVQEVASILQDPFRYGKDVAKQEMGSVVPSVVAAAAHAMDPTVRKADITSDILSPLKARIPGLSQTLPAQTGPAGEELQRPTPLQEFVNPFRVSSEHQGPAADVERELVRLGMTTGERIPDHVPIKGHKVDLLPQEQAIWGKAHDWAAQYIANNYLPSAAYQALPDNEGEAKDGQMSKEKLIKQKYARASEIARQQLLMDPAFRARARDVLSPKAAAQ